MFVFKRKRLVLIKKELFVQEDQAIAKHLSIELRDRRNAICPQLFESIRGISNSDTNLSCNLVSSSSHLDIHGLAVEICVRDYVLTVQEYSTELRRSVLENRNLILKNNTDLTRI